MTPPDPSLTHDEPDGGGPQPNREPERIPVSRDSERFARDAALRSAPSGPGRDPARAGGGTAAASDDADTAALATPELDDLRPAEIVRRLDEYIIGQRNAKRAVAVALRNRMRRQKLPEDIRDEVLPKNILMIGPTGVGKTELARRLARMTNSPFLKVEATKFTEVGYVGRDVESIVRDLLEQTITEVHNDRIAEVEDRARDLAEARIVETLVTAEQRASSSPAAAAVDEHASPPPAAAAGTDAPGAAAAPSPDPQASRRRARALRRRLARLVAERRIEDRVIEIEVEEQFQAPVDTFSGTGMEEVGMSLADFFSQMAPPRRRMKRMTVAEARSALTQEETDHLVDIDRVYDDSIHLVEESGIVFIDEVDKICGPASDTGPDVSGQGVQRDLLPLLEGSAVHTRYGMVRTDHILFVAAGAFTQSRPSELIPEFQGRFPIRVELTPLAEQDLRRILVEPGNALTKQYTALLHTEDVTLEFGDDGIDELAHQAFLVNEQDENIGARRLFTIVEKVLEDLSFDADRHAGETVRVDRDFVRGRLADLVRNEDLRRYIL